MSLAKKLSKTSFKNCCKTGLSALKRAHQNLVALKSRSRGLESLDLDCCIPHISDLTKEEKGNAANWDYLISVGNSLRKIERCDALEPHPGGVDEVLTIENKKVKTAAYLITMNLPSPDRWVWIQTKNAIPPNDPIAMKLAQNGIQLSGKNYPL